MKTSSHIENKVEETLTSLDHVRRASANPFLYTRIMASLNAEEESVWAVALRFVSRPVIAFATILVIILINTIALYESSETVQTPVQEEDQIFASEYNLSATTADGLYTVNEEQP
jgi:hypothetical protein